MLVALYVVPPIVCLAMAAITTGPGPQLPERLADQFAVFALLGFIALLIVAFFAGPTRVDMYVPSPYPRVTLRTSLQGKMDFSHASFPIQVMAVIAALVLLGIGYLVSS